MMDIRSYQSTDMDEVIELWGEAFPNAPTHNDLASDIQLKLKIQPELFFVAVDDGDLVGTAMAGFDGHRGWVYSRGANKYGEEIE